MAVSHPEGLIVGDTGAAQTRTARNWWRSPEFGHFLLALPAVVFLLVIFVYPMARIAALSFLNSLITPKPNLDNYIRVFTSPSYMRVMKTTFFISTAVTLFSLGLGYPVAYVLSSVKKRVSALLMILVLMPLWTSALVHCFAWIAILRPNGLVNDALRALGLIDQPLTLVFNTTGTLIGMTQVMLPLMIIPLNATMQGIDKNLMKAAASLGATPLHTFVKIFLPLSLPGVGAGGLLVFISSLGFFITPALLGGMGDMMIAQMIKQQAQALLNWGLASALSMILLLAALAVFYVYDRFLGLDKMWGGIS
jgi:putative spermidine/putrescine transport system permease protein